MHTQKTQPEKQRLQASAIAMIEMFLIAVGFIGMGVSFFYIAYLLLIVVEAFC